MKQRTQLEENLKSIEIELIKEELQIIDKAALVGSASGNGYPGAVMSTVNR